MRTWMIVLALVLGLAAPLWAEDDGAPAPQPVVENQVPPDFVPGIEIISSSVPHPNDDVDPLRFGEKYGADKVYVDPQTGMATIYATQDGTVVTKEAWAEDMRQIGIKHKTDTRKWVNEAIGAEKQGYRKFGESADLEINVNDDVRVNDVVNGTLASQQRLEQMIDDRQTQVDEEVKRVVPLRTLRSLESTGGDQR